MTAAKVATLADFLLARIAETKAAADADRGEWAEFVAEDCEAKRRIVEEFTMITLLDYEHPIGPAEGAYVKAQQILKHLAAIYADHPDYDEAWRP